MGGGNRYFSEYNYDGSRKEDETPSLDTELHIPHASGLVKEAQLKILSELKESIDMHKPSFRHQQDSSFDNGKANGLHIAMMYIDLKIKELS